MSTCGAGFWLSETVEENLMHGIGMPWTLGPRDRKERLKGSARRDFVRDREEGGWGWGVEGVGMGMGS